MEMNHHSIWWTLSTIWYGGCYPSLLVAIQPNHYPPNLVDVFHWCFHSLLCLHLCNPSTPQINLFRCHMRVICIWAVYTVRMATCYPFQSLLATLHCTRLNLASPSFLVHGQKTNWLPFTRSEGLPLSTWCWRRWREMGTLQQTCWWIQVNMCTRGQQGVHVTGLLSECAQVQTEGIEDM